MGKPAGQSQAKAGSEQALAQSKQTFAQQQDIFNQIKPFATSLMSLGIDPRQFMTSPLGQALLGQARQGISSEFQSARNNLAENLGSSGLVGSGVGLGPLANLYGQEAMANSNLFQQIPMQGLQLGLSGANALTGQQQILNPLGYLGTGISGLNNLQQGGFGYQFANSLGTSLGKTLGSPQFGAGPFGFGSQG